MYISIYFFGYTKDAFQSIIFLLTQNKTYTQTLKQSKAIKYMLTYDVLFTVQNVQYCFQVNYVTIT